MTRRTYNKPQIKRIPLTIKEAVLATCKTSSGGDTKNTQCRTGTTGGCCRDSNAT